MQSLKNSSNVPLRGSAIFIGSWDDILNYQNVQVTLNADSNCEITYYTTNDKVYIESVTYPYVSGSNYFNSINSTSRYVYFTVRNTTTTNQDTFNFSVLYKLSPVSSGGSGGDVTIIDPLIGGSVSINLNAINSSFIDVANNNGLKVAVQNSSIAVTNSSLSSMTFNTNRLTVLDSDANTKLTNIYNKINSRGTSQLYNGAIIAGGYTNVLNLSDVIVKNLTIYGNQDSNGNVLYLLFSNDGITFYLSQYSYSFGALVNGNFGFNIPCCPRYISVQSTNACSLTLFVDYC